MNRRALSGTLSSARAKSIPLSRNLLSDPNSRGGIRTRDLVVMGHASFQTALPCDISIDYLLFSIYDCKKPAWDGQDSCLRSHAQHFILCYIGSLVGKPLPLRFHATAPCRLWSGLLVTRLCARGYRGPPDLPKVLIELCYQMLPVIAPGPCHNCTRFNHDNQCTNFVEDESLRANPTKSGPTAYGPVFVNHHFIDTSKMVDVLKTYRNRSPLYVRRMVMKSIMPAGSSGGLA